MYVTSCLLFAIFLTLFLLLMFYMFLPRDAYAYAQTPLIRFVVDLLYNFSICCELVVDFMGQGVT